MNSYGRYDRGLFTSVGMAALLLASPALGQAAGQAAPPQAGPAPDEGPALTPQDAPATSQEAESTEGDIVVTGFRAALDSALNQKREETAAIDSIVAEDIGKFPDSNLAESMQRIPGVALARGDGGEGRNISVRGLGAQFTRVRINGMEGVSQVSASDIRGGVGSGSGRSFDFVTFPTEIFSALSVRKTTSADVEEGSLGATVDLRAPKPFDQRKDFVFSGTARGIYNDIRKDVDPRLSALAAKKFGDFGVLGSVAYTKRRIDEYAYSAVDLLPTYIAGLAQPVPTAPGAAATTSVLFPFCTPVGYAYNGGPVNSPRTGFANSGNSVGATATDCSTGNPRTSTREAYDYIMSRTGVSGRPGGGVFLPRLPRPVKSSQDQERLAGSLTFQWKPTDRTDISIDGLYARFKVDRLDTYFDARSMGRNASNNGQPMMSVKDIEVDDLGSLVYGLWDGVDLRAEMQDEQFTSVFRQVNLNLDHRFSDTFRVFGLAGLSDSRLHVNRLQVAIDSNDTDDFSIDFRDGGDLPLLGYGADTTDPSLFLYGPPLPNGDQRGQISSFDRRNVVENRTFELNAEWEAAPDFTVQVGGQYRRGEYSQNEQQLEPAFRLPLTLPAGVTPADFTFTVTGVGDNLGGNMQDFVAVDPDRFREAVGFADYPFCGVECASPYGVVNERYASGYAMVRFNTRDTLPIAIRGDAGVRYVHTKFDTEGVIPTAGPAGSAFPTIGVIAEVERSYDDWLPSANLAIDLTPELIGRLSAARVLSRPSYGQLIPSGGVNTAFRTGSFSNPFLDPIRANTFDASLEWYFARGSLISIAYFYKNIETYIQNTNALVPFRELGLPDSLLVNTNVTPEDLFNVSRSDNTPGGPLRGFEANVQLPLRFLPGPLSNLGVLASFTRVRSDIDYILQSVNGVPTLTTTAPLVGLSPETASGTLYYEDERFSIRSTVNYRAGYITGIPGPADSDAVGAKGSIFVDASASYNINENVKLIAEVQNITDERNRLYTDTTRQDPLYTSYFGRTFALAVNFQF